MAAGEGVPTVVLTEALAICLTLSERSLNLLRTVLEEKKDSIQKVAEVEGGAGLGCTELVFRLQSRLALNLEMTESITQRIGRI